MTDQKSMKNAYRIAQEMIDDRLKERDPDAYKDLKDIKEADVIVIRGEYDHIEQVLSMSETPFTIINPEDLNRAELRSDQIIFVNCPGQIREKGLRKLTTFVNEGGFLFTTDWALKHVLEKSFPGYVEYNEKATADEVVRVEVLDTEDPFLKSILGPEDDPQWWLEGSSYPIRILDNEKVVVLVKSKEIEKRYGEAPVFITFDHGKGKIYHMISHFYLQRTETRTERHAASGTVYMEEKEIAAPLKAKYAAMGIDKSTVADVESAYTSSAMMKKILFDKKQQMRKGKKKNEK
jgi:hypothetical protein